MFIFVKRPCEVENHKCPLRCSETCQPCVILVRKQLPCGHSTELPCHVEPASVRCKEPVQATLPSCGHLVWKPCYQDPELSFCSEPCTSRLPCGHACVWKCHVENDPDHLEYRCLKECTNTNTNCRRNHACPKKCYEKCGDCPVLIQIQLPCGHRQKMACSQDETLISCMKTCTKTLPCGHKCPFLCSVDCDPKRCVQLRDAHIAVFIVTVVRRRLLPIVVHNESVSDELSEDGLERRCLITGPALERDSSTALPIDIRSCPSDIRVPSAALKSQLCFCLSTDVALCVVSLSTTTVMERRAFQKTMEDCSILAELELDTDSNIVNDTDDDPDFSRVDKEGTCGHVFEKLKCNEGTESRKCLKRCTRKLPCGHPCHGTCWKDCTSDLCREMVVSTVTPACGHTDLLIPCHLNISVVNQGSDELLQCCNTPCKSQLPCGHDCAGVCGACMQGRLHMPCTESCNKELICGHISCVADFSVYHCHNELVVNKKLFSINANLSRN
ncbi:NFX1-type zinc finger-containing protein 1 [Homalodisca vitripennis]|nr:NFX1-type zinc finger-containing protein 1 [Homalodisca vitripennis]